MHKHQDRILLLKQFTAELIINSKPLEPQKNEEIKSKIYPELPLIVNTQPILKQAEKTTKKRIRLVPRKIMKKPSALYKSNIRPVKVFPIRNFATQPMRTNLQAPQLQSSMHQMSPTFQHNTEEFDLGKLSSLLRDPRVTTIECTGPGRNILAKMGGAANVTKISLTKDEIQEVIDKFSQEAKIPIISGMFKAVAKNLIITAVISENIGSRFIISKLTPRAMLEQGF